MATIYQDLKLQSDPSTVVRPNVEAQNIPSGAISENKIASGAVTSEKLGSNSVTSSKIYPLAVQESHISAGAVTADKISGGAVTGSKIASSAVTASKIAYGSYSLDALRPQSVEELANVLLKFLVEPADFKIYYAREIESGKTDFSTIDFCYDATNKVLKMILNNAVISVDSSSYGSFMNSYAAYIYIQRIS